MRLSFAVRRLAARRQDGPSRTFVPDAVKGGKVSLPIPADEGGVIICVAVTPSPQS